MANPLMNAPIVVLETALESVEAALVFVDHLPPHRARLSTIAWAIRVAIQALREQV